MMVLKPMMYVPWVCHRQNGRIANITTWPFPTGESMTVGRLDRASPPERVPERSMSSACAGNWTTIRGRMLSSIVGPRPPPAPNPPPPPPPPPPPRPPRPPGAGAAAPASAAGWAGALPDGGHIPFGSHVARRSGLAIGFVFCQVPPPRPPPPPPPPPRPPLAAAETCGAAVCPASNSGLWL